jgi:succinyl-CoA synthetase alpha subunit
MSILVSKNTRIITQGITGKFGSYHTGVSLKYGSCFVGGVTPNKGGQNVHGLPVFNTVKEAKNQTGCNATVIFVPPNFAKDALIEAIDSEIELIVCITEGIPLKDMLQVHACLKKSQKSKLIGPNCPGIVAPGLCRIGIMPENIFKKGSLGIVSRSGTLTYEAIFQSTKANIGQSTCVGIGGDPIIGLDFIDVIKLFEKDEETKAILMIGEIGGHLEEEASYWIKNNTSKPIFSYIAGRFAPKGTTMGHAGAIIEDGFGGVKEKLMLLKDAGVHVIVNLHEIGSEIKKIMECHV